MKRKVFLFFLLIVFFGCKELPIHNITSEVIHLNPHQADEYLNLSEIVDSVEVIRLKTPADEVLGRVREVIVKDRYIYAVDASQQAVFLFDKKGEFVSKLSKIGRGPGEYLSMRSVFVDDQEEYIEIVNFQGKESYLQKYQNPSFDFMGRTPIVGAINENVTRKVGNTYYHATQQLDNVIDGKKTNAGLIISRDGKIVKTLFDKVIETENSGFTPNGESFVMNDKNELFISLMYDNTFYKIEGDSVFPAITVDFGEYGMDNSIGKKPLKKQMEYIEGTNGIATFPVLNLNNSNIVSFSYYFKQDAKERFYRGRDLQYYIRFKDKIHHVKRIRNDITDFPDNIYLNSYYPSCTHQVYYKDYLVDVYMPNKQLLSDDSDSDRIFAEGIGEITADDNPLVILMKLKQ